MENWNVIKTQWKHSNFSFVMPLPDWLLTGSKWKLPKLHCSHLPSKECVKVYRRTNSIMQRRKKKNSHQNCCVYELSCVTRTRERGHQEVMMQELSIHRLRLSTILSPFTTKFTYTVYIFLCIKVKRNITSGVRQDSTWFTVTQDKISVSR